jgi:hypothetical protein
MRGSLLTVTDIKKTTRKFFSEKILAFAGALPRFQKGPIYDLQQIFEHQQRQSNKYHQEALAPDGQSIALRHITLAFLYEFENQISVNKQLKRKLRNHLFPSTHFDDIDKLSLRLDAASWHNLGDVFRGHKAHCASSGITDDSLPFCVKSLHFSQMQIMPSISCLEVTVRVSDEAHRELERISQQAFMPKVLLHGIFKGFFQSNGFGYSTLGRRGTEEKASLYIQEVCQSVEKWLFDFFDFKKGQLRIVAKCPVYILDRVGDSREKDFLEYTKEHWRWLSKFGFESHALNAYHNHRTLFSWRVSSRHNAAFDVIFAVNEDEDDYFNTYLDELARGFVCLSSVQGFLEQARTNIERLRFSILMRLRNKKSVLASFSQTTLALRSELSRVRHVRAEFQHNKFWFKRSLEGIGDLECRKSKKFDGTLVRYVDSELASLCDVAELLDKSITDQLEIENIAAMFALQRRIFWLTLVAAFAGLVGVVSVWDKIENLLEAIRLMTY